MSVYVDPLMIFGDNKAPRCFRNKSSCHMYADSLVELHSMAKILNLKYTWFQNNPHLQHYDLTESKRILALKIGVIEHTRREAVVKWRELRQRRINESHFQIQRNN